MRNYFVNMVFTDISAELIRIDKEEANQDLENLGGKLILITCMIVTPNQINQVGPLATIVDITPSHLEKAASLMVTEDFSNGFRNMCQMDTIPDINLQQIKLVKTEFIDKIMPASNQE